MKSWSSVFLTIPFASGWIVVLNAGCGTATTTPPSAPNESLAEVEAPTPPSQSEAPIAPPVSVEPPAASTAASTAAPPPPPPCPVDMVLVEKTCVDRYEAPNQGGKPPLVMATADEAVAWCTERDKRLCTEDEWLRACQGPKGLRYPYGTTYQESYCNHDKKYRVPKWGALGQWPGDTAVAEVNRLNQSEPSGTRHTCGATEGVFDLTGNVAEWVVKLHDHPEACKSAEEKKHRYVVQGCSWVKCYREPHEPACDYVNCAHPSGFRSYDTGFRCCRDARPAGP